MSAASKFLRAAVLASSVTLLAGYVVYSHVTPNTPPPDPFGLNGIELTMEPEVIEFEGFINDGVPVPPGNRSDKELRIISSKNITQPIFSTRKSNSQSRAQVVDPRPTFWSRLFNSKSAGQHPPDSAKSGQEIRIISSKVINQPVFSVRTIHWGFIESPEATDPFAAKPLPHRRFPPRAERVGTWLHSIEMTGMALDPLRGPAADRP